MSANSDLHDIKTNKPIAPHQEEWAEKRMLVVQAVARGWCHKGNERKEMDATLAFAIVEEIMPLLLSLHKADCERFRGMIPKKMTMSAANKTRSEAGAGYTIGYNGLIDKLNTALSKMEEEKV